MEFLYNVDWQDEYFTTKSDIKFMKEFIKQTRYDVYKINQTINKTVNKVNNLEVQLNDIEKQTSEILDILKYGPLSQARIEVEQDFHDIVEKNKILF